MKSSIRFDEQSDGWCAAGAKKAAMDLARIARLDDGTRSGHRRRIVEHWKPLIEPGDAVALEVGQLKQAGFPVSARRQSSRPTRRSSMICTF